jgi:Peptidase family M28
MWWIAIVAVAILAAGVAGVLHYMIGVPGKSHRGALPPLTQAEAALAAALKQRIATIAAREHNLVEYDELEKVARYIEATVASFGYTVGRQEFIVEGKPVRNIDAVIEPRAGTADPEVIVVGAHYDSVRGAPGANDNASGSAAVIELARLLRDLDGKSDKRIRFVLFVNEEPPYFRTEAMGSLRYARALAERRERVVGMYSLETIGFYSNKPGSQRFPFPLGILYPDRGDFIAFVGLLGSRPLVHRTMRSFRSHTAFPSVGGAVPDAIPGTGWSDHWAFAQHGFQALMITDTAPFRYVHYHQPSDTPDKVDTESVARLVKGIERVIRDLVRS